MPDETMYEIETVLERVGNRLGFLCSIEEEGEAWVIRSGEIEIYRGRPPECRLVAAGMLAVAKLWKEKSG